MRKLIIVLTTAALAAAETAVGATNETLTAEQKAERREKMMLIKGGPKLVKPGTQKGCITVVDAQSAAAREWLDASIRYLGDESDFKIEIQPGRYEAAKPQAIGEATIFVIDDVQAPRSLVAPEDRWAMLNVAPLKDARPQFFEARVKKEMSRVFSMLCGGMASGFNLSLAGPMPKVADLDAIPDHRLPYDVVMRFKPHMRRFGVTTGERKSYRAACEEGWAPAPQTKVEKIIWEEVHAKPTKPMKVKYGQPSAR